MQIFSYKYPSTPLLLPLVLSVVEAGFPSPAEGQIDRALDLNELLIDHPSSTYFVRVQGDSMSGAGIYHGDLLIVDRSKQPKSGDVIIAALNGTFTVKRWRPFRGQLSSNRYNNSSWGSLNCAELVAEHPDYPPITVSANDDFMIWGVVQYTIHRT